MALRRSQSTKVGTHDAPVICPTTTHAFSYYTRFPFTFIELIDKFNENEERFMQQTVRNITSAVANASIGVSIGASVRPRGNSEVSEPAAKRRAKAQSFNTNFHHLASDFSIPLAMQAGSNFAYPPTQPHAYGSASTVDAHEQGFTQVQGSFYPQYAKPPSSALPLSIVDDSMDLELIAGLFPGFVPPVGDAPPFPPPSVTAPPNGFLGFGDSVSQGLGNSQVAAIGGIPPTTLPSALVEAIRTENRIYDHHSGMSSNKADTYVARTSAADQYTESTRVKSVTDTVNKLSRCIGDLAEQISRVHQADIDTECARAIKFLLMPVPPNAESKHVEALKAQAAARIAETFSMSHSGLDATRRAEQIILGVLKLTDIQKAADQPREMLSDMIDTPPDKSAVGQGSPTSHSTPTQ